MACEMCGKEGDMFKTEVEGSVMTVCQTCAKFGKIIARPKPVYIQKKQFKPQKKTEPETIFLIVNDYSEKLKNAREKLNLKQEDVAKQIAEKESLINSVESGKHEPNINLARKLENFFKIKLVEQHKEESTETKRQKSEGFTIGDFIKKK
jgi:putative transcription factor